MHPSLILPLSQYSSEFSTPPLLLFQENQTIIPTTTSPSLFRKSNCYIVRPRLSNSFSIFQSFADILLDKARSGQFF